MTMVDNQTMLQHDHEIAMKLMRVAGSVKTIAQAQLAIQYAKLAHEAVKLPPAKNLAMRITERMNSFIREKASQHENQI